jgi:hypothetical protein
MVIIVCKLQPDTFKQGVKITLGWVDSGKVATENQSYAPYHLVLIRLAIVIHFARDPGAVSLIFHGGGQGDVELQGSMNW